MDITVQSLMEQELLQQNSEENEMLQVVEFMRDNGVPITPHQAAAQFLLNENGVEDLANFIGNVRKTMTPTRKYFDLINKLTLADRIKGNAKLSNILKANANPANSLNANMGAQGGSMK